MPISFIFFKLLMKCFMMKYSRLWPLPFLWRNLPKSIVLFLIFRPILERCKYNICLLIYYISRFSFFNNKIIEYFTFKIVFLSSKWKSIGSKAVARNLDAPGLNLTVLLPPTPLNIGFYLCGCLTCKLRLFINKLSQ